MASGRFPEQQNNLSPITTVSVRGHGPVCASLLGLHKKTMTANGYTCIKPGRLPPNYTRYQPRTCSIVFKKGRGGGRLVTNIDKQKQINL